ncbi:YolD-like family protein [Alkalibacillus haloalkaliphilus]|uniref:YolD-like family protein n=1 Tax=Alkalibacillus haloalkaliphilus TaxID=94136 RepID=UPI00293635D6|nr:YolD-like family protein [Alkalibacillus haloalkaliphilus]MDV2580687.1 YolD-like family protein [Alkalibacillus haloalkaliphilus]
MHHDRGSIKWASLMLPEHVEALQQIWQESEHEQPPLIDEQQLEEHLFYLSQAYEEQLEVKVIYFKYSRYDEIIGRVMDWSREQQAVRLQTKHDKRDWIKLKHIKQVTL